MKTLNVKVKAGQTWEHEGSEVFTASLTNGVVSFNDPRFTAQERMNLKDFCEVHSFVPQTDLEWLSVKVETWAIPYSNSISRGPNNSFDYSEPCQNLNYPQKKYTIEQLNEAKSELGINELTKPQPEQWTTDEHQENIHPGVESDSAAKELDRDKYDKGMRDCVKDIAQIIGLSFGASVGYANLADELKDFIDNEINKATFPVKDKPVFTQAMCDAKQMPPIGSMVMIRYLPYHGKDYEWFEHEVYGYKGDRIICDHSEVSEMVELFKGWKPIKTDAEKLRDTIKDCMMDGSYQGAELTIDKLLASDKFEIKLKG